MASDEAAAWAKTFTGNPGPYLTEAEERLFRERLAPHGGPTWHVTGGAELALSERLVATGMAKETEGNALVRRFRLHSWAHRLLSMDRQAFIRTYRWYERLKVIDPILEPFGFAVVLRDDQSRPAHCRVTIAFIGWP